MRERITHLFSAVAIAVCLICLFPVDAGAQVLDIYDVNPGSGYQGEDYSLEITGNLFMQDTDVTFSNPGIIVTGITYQYFTTLFVDISVDLDASLGDVDVTVHSVTGQFATLKAGFVVLDTLIPVLDSFAPTSAMQGTLGISGVLNGIELLQGGLLDFVPSGGPQIVNAVYQSQNSYLLTIDVPEDAIPGFYDLNVTFPGTPWNLTLPSAFEVIEIPTTYDLFIEPNPTVFGYAGEMWQADFLFGIDSNKPDTVNGPINLFASEATDPVSGNSIGLSNIDIAPGSVGSLLPGLYEQATLAVEIPLGIGEGEYWGTITLSAPGIGEEIFTSFTVIVMPTPGDILYPNLGREELEIDLIWPGSPDTGELEEVLEETPLFEWASSAPFFDFYLFDASVADNEDEIAGSIQFLEPIFIDRDVSSTIMYYSLAAEPLVPGHIYSWYVEAKDIPSYDPIVTDRDPEMIRSEVFYFKYINLDEGTGSPEVMSIAVEPGYVEADVGDMVQFDAILELLGAGFVDVDWKVIPSSFATVHANGEVAYVKPLKTGFVSVVAEVGDLSAYALIRVGEAEQIAKVDFDTTTLNTLEERLNETSSQIALLKDLSDDELELTSELYLASENQMNISTSFKSVFQDTFNLLEPLFLDGKASLSNPHFGDWIEVEFLSPYATLYVKDKDTWDRFKLGKLTPCEEIRNRIEQSYSDSLEVTETLLGATTDIENAGSLVLNTSANVDYNLASLELEIEDILFSLEVDARPFAPAA